ncbi:4147_t:CDS:2, partial [Cetraspora pellucida]
IYFSFVVSAYATQCKKNNEKIVPLQTDTGKTIAVLFDICAIIAIILFFNHDIFAWVVADIVDIIIAVHFALVVAAYYAQSKGNIDIDKEPA